MFHNILFGAVIGASATCIGHYLWKQLTKSEEKHGPFKKSEEKLTQSEEEKLIFDPSLKIDPTLVVNMKIYSDDRILYLQLSCLQKYESDVRQLITDNNMNYRERFDINDHLILTFSGNKKQLEKIMDCQYVFQIRELASASIAN